MPLSTAVERKHLHTRTIRYDAFERDDGLWDIEAHLVMVYDLFNVLLDSDC